MSVIVEMVDHSERYEEPGDGLPLTLIVNGAVITGDVIPAAAWVKRVDGEFGGDTWLGDVADDLAREARLSRESMDLPAAQWTPEHSKAADVEPTSVHLENARIISTGFAWTAPTYWRVRITDVSGWCYGVMATKEDPPDDE